MTTNLIFDDQAKRYVCVNIFGQTVPFQNEEVNFLSKQMKYFGNLTVNSVSKTGRIVLLEDRQNNMFISFNGNVPFRLTVFTTRQGDMPLIERLEQFTITEGSVPKYKMLLVTDEMAKRLNESWGEEFAKTIEEHRNYRLLDMKNNSDAEILQIKNAYRTTRNALKRSIETAKKQEQNAKDEMLIVNNIKLPKDNKRIFGNGIVQKIDAESQTSIVFTKDEISFDNFEYFEDVCRQCINIAELNDQQKTKPTRPIDVIQLQKPNEMGERSFGRK